VVQEMNRSLILCIETADDVKEGGLPCPVGADDAGDDICRYVEGDAIHGRYPPKSFGYMRDPKHDSPLASAATSHHPPCLTPAIPPGMKINHDDEKEPIDNDIKVLEHP